MGLENVIAKWRHEVSLVIFALTASLPEHNSKKYNSDRLFSYMFNSVFI